MRHDRQHEGGAWPTDASSEALSVGVSERGMLWATRAVLALGGTGVLVAGLLTWSEPIQGEVFAVRLLIAVAAAGILSGSFVDRVRPWTRISTFVLILGMLAWFLWVSACNRMRPEDIVGITPIVVAAGGFTRRPSELGAAFAVLYGGLAGAYAIVPEPVLPPAITFVMTTLLLAPVGILSIARVTLHERLLDVNRTLDQRVRDRTARLARSEAEARRSNEAKSRFLANMSHELRTPLTGVLGHVEMAQEELEGREPEVEDDLERAKTAGHQLLGLIDGLLDLTRIEAAPLDIDSAGLEVDPLVETAVQLARPAIEANGNTVNTGRLEGSVVADRQALVQVLVNLLGNAGKFTSDGEVTVESRTHGQTTHITVSDTGIGIPADQQDVIFERFAQADDSSTRRYGGSGLGLAIARELVRAMDGRITVSSQLGEGSAFTVELPSARG